jgi:hypothetical protein
MTTMKKLRALLASALLAASAAVAAQTAPAQPAAAQQPPPQAPEKPRLNLRLDDRDLRSATPYTPKEDGKKQDASDGLPGLGGKPTTSWDQPAPEKVVPISNDKM